jgi:hypothetical protein
MGGKVNCIGDFHRTCPFKGGDIGIPPNNFRTVTTIELFDSLAWIACDHSERINRMGEHAG